MNTSVVNSQEPEKATLLLSFRDKYDLNTIFDFTEDAKTGSDFLFTCYELRLGSNS